MHQVVDQTPGAGRQRSELALAPSTVGRRVKARVIWGQACGCAQGQADARSRRHSSSGSLGLRPDRWWWVFPAEMRVDITRLSGLALALTPVLVGVRQGEGNGSGCRLRVGTTSRPFSCIQPLISRSGCRRCKYMATFLPWVFHSLGVVLHVLWKVSEVVDLESTAWSSGLSDIRSCCGCPARPRRRVESVRAIVRGHMVGRGAVVGQPVMPSMPKATISACGEFSS